jgi:hypothetical protein
MRTTVKNKGGTGEDSNGESAARGERSGLVLPPSFPLSLPPPLPPRGKKCWPGYCCTSTKYSKLSAGALVLRISPSFSGGLTMRIRLVLRISPSFSGRLTMRTRLGIGTVPLTREPAGSHGGGGARGLVRQGGSPWRPGSPLPRRQWSLAGRPETFGPFPQSWMRAAAPHHPQYVSSIIHAYHGICITTSCFKHHHGLRNGLSPLLMVWYLNHPKCFKRHHGLRNGLSLLLMVWNLNHPECFKHHHGLRNGLSLLLMVWYLNHPECFKHHHGLRNGLSPLLMACERYLYHHKLFQTSSRLT